jgi:hypothetical protein
VYGREESSSGPTTHPAWAADERRRWGTASTVSSLGRWPLHLVMDDYGTHGTPEVQAWLNRRRRFHVHNSPTSFTPHRGFQTILHEARLGGLGPGSLYRERRGRTLLTECFRSRSVLAGDFRVMP